MLAGFADNLRAYANRSRRPNGVALSLAPFAFASACSDGQASCRQHVVLVPSSADCLTPLISQACPLSAHKGGNPSLEGKKRRAGVMSVLPLKA